MKCKNIDLINILNVLLKYSDKKFPQKISYAITRNLMLLSKDKEVYETSLKNLFNSYEKDFIKDKAGKPVVNNIGIPLVKDISKEQFDKELSDLLSIEIDVNLYSIDESCFDYDDSDKYDLLTPNELLSLISVLCLKKENGDKK